MERLRFWCLAHRMELATDQCGRQHEAAVRAVRKAGAGGDAFHASGMANARKCAECPLGAAYAGKDPAKAAERAWPYPKLPPGLVVEGERILREPPPFRYSGTAYLWLENVHTGTRRTLSVDYVRGVVKRGRTGKDRPGRRSEVIIVNGERTTIRECAERLGCAPQVIHSRRTLLGWSLERAATTPVSARRPRVGSRGRAA